MARDFRSEYRNYQGKPSQIKKRAKRNAARRMMMRAGKTRKGDGKDVHHKSGNPMNNKRSNLAVKSKSRNRSFKRTRTARKAKR